jgi:hypothetical protein
MKIGIVILFPAFVLGSSVPAAAEPNTDPNVVERVTNNADLVRFRTEAYADVAKPGRPCKPTKRPKKDRQPQKPNGS